MTHNFWEYQRKIGHAQHFEDCKTMIKHNHPDFLISHLNEIKEYKNSKTFLELKKRLDVEHTKWDKAVEARRIKFGGKPHV